MRSEIIRVRTGGRQDVRDITGECAQFAKAASEGGDGLLHVFVPHATAGVALIELGSGSDDDLLAALGEMLPADDRWRHAHGSRGHGRSHVLPALIPPYADRKSTRLNSCHVEISYAVFCLKKKKKKKKYISISKKKKKKKNKKK